MYKNNHKTLYKVIITMLVVSLFATHFYVSAATLPYDASITIDFNVPVKDSTLELGVTNTHFYWDKGDPAAVDRALDLMNGTVAYSNQHIMGWGAENPQPLEGGPYIWEGEGYLDERVQLMRAMGGEMVLTLCTAPGWMKTSGSDWNMGDRVADEHFEDFAKLCAAVAERYTDVMYFQVWNEFKGFWDSNIQNSDGSTGNWDYIKYTQMYNAVYNAVKAVRPDAKVGGFYLPIDGDGSNTLGRVGDSGITPLGTKDKDALQYWLNNKVGADFICVDRWLRDWQSPADLTKDDHMALTFTYKSAVEGIREYTDLPIWFSEYYSDRDNWESEADNQYIAAAMASIYYQMIMAGGNSEVVALLWNPTEGEDLVYHKLFTSTNEANGAVKTPHYDVFKGIEDYFSSGTQLYKAESSDAKIEVLASKEKTMIVNKYNETKKVVINGFDLYTLAPYEVLFIDSPRNLIHNGSFEVNGLAGWTIENPKYGWSDSSNYYGDGTTSVNFWGGAPYVNSLSTTVEACEAGNYEAKMFIRSGGQVNSVRFEVFDGDVLLDTVDIAISDAWTQYTLDNIEINQAADITIKVTVDAISNYWAYFDLFELYKVDSFSLEEVNVSTEYGIAPVLPATVNAVYEDGTVEQLAVVWDTIASSDLYKIGSFVIEGIAEGAVNKAKAIITVNPIDSEPFLINAAGNLDREGAIKASVSVERVAGTIDHDGNEVVIFQLFKNDKPIDMIAIETDIQEKEDFIAYFYVSNEMKEAYSVKVFVFDEFYSDTSVAISLSNDLTIY